MTYVLTVTMTFPNKAARRRFEDKVLKDPFNGPIWYDIREDEEEGSE